VSKVKKILAILFVVLSLGTVTSVALNTPSGAGGARTYPSIGNVFGDNNPQLVPQDLQDVHQNQQSTVIGIGTAKNILYDTEGRIVQNLR